MGPDLAYLARYFYFVTVLCHLQFALVYFANWPYRGVFGTDTAPQPECGFLRCAVSAEMTDDQAKLVRLYTISTIIAFAMLCFWGLPYRLFKAGKKIFYPYRKDKSGKASDVLFRSLVGVNAYIPIVRRGAFFTPYIVSSISNTPKKYIPLHSGLKWDELPDPKEFSVFNRTDFVHIPDEQLKRAISTVMYYGGDDDISAEMKAQRAASQMGGGAPPRDSGGWMDEDGLEMLPPLDAAPALRRQKSARVQCDLEEEALLPTGWEKRQGPDGGVFYMDNNTNTTHHSLPSPDASAPHFLEGRSSIYLSSRNLGADSMFEERESVVRLTPAKNMMYRASTGGSGYEGEVRVDGGGIAILPPGWEEMFTPDGVPYFVDHNTKTSQWTLPESVKEFVMGFVEPHRSSV